MCKILGSSYVPPHQEDYFKLPWYERDLMTYIDHLKYREMADDPDHYYRNKTVINFDIINHQYCGDPLKKSIKEHKTVYNDHLRNYPENEKKKVMSAILEIKGMIFGSKGA